MFTKVIIIGSGNIGTWLLQTLQNQKGFSVISVSSRKIETLPQDGDLYIFALKDDVYETVLQQISFKMPRAVHTSGALSQSILVPFAKKVGVMYPYQSVRCEVESVRQKAEGRRQKGERWKEKVPVCVEGSDKEFEDTLFQWAKRMFEDVYKINEQQRFAMHLAAVFANNFTNAMYGVAYQIFKENNIDWSLIFPLLNSTLEKAKHNDPALVQTGPALRHDVSVMEKHCKALRSEDLRMVYRGISRVILKG
ncbi:MAG: DUF2520 domain-containing protein [Lentimicrobiaceae bacterium]|nr:DUF2520 domain-containing protein [Lentimicrobiaceae bacterium]